MSHCTYLMLFIYYLTTISSFTKAQERVPHGLFNENSLISSPSAYDFFHPEQHDSNHKATLCTASGCAPLPVVAEVEAAQAEENVLSTPHKGGHHVSSGGVAAIVFGLACVAFFALGAYYVVSKRRANMSRQGTSQADA